MLSRRKFLQTATLAAAASALPGAPSFAADPAKPNTQAPGYFRFNLGEIEVTAVFDGWVKIKPSILHGLPENELSALLAEYYFDPQEGLPASINAFVINTGGNLVLVDAGAGNYFGQRAGKLCANLQASGYRPEEIDTVLLTHLHSDHSLGLIDAQGSPLFPQAKIKVCEAELAYWQNDELLAKAPEERKPFLKKLRAALAPYAASGNLQSFVCQEPPLPGVESLNLSGHTPGQSGFKFSSNGQSLLVWGDIVHNWASQFVKPEVTIDFDVDQSAAMQTRQKLLAELAKTRSIVAGAHLPFPGLGYVRKRPQGYAFLPLEYSVAAAEYS